MWSFDDEENKQDQDNEENASNENKGEEGASTRPGENGDDFGERDPFSRGGDFYSSYSGASSGDARKTPNKSGKGGAFLAILICAAIFLSTAAIINLMGNGISLGGIVMGTTSATASATAPSANATGGTQATSPTLGGTQATAPSISTNQGTPVTPTYVYWDAAVVEHCLNTSVLITVEGVGSGSGVIYTQDGYILTNYHVVSNNNKTITVTLFSGEKLTATYIYGDESNDISVIKIEKSDCTFAKVSGEAVTYMTPVMVIGNALGKGFNTTQGVVSAPASKVYFSSTNETMTLIQIDAAVNSGNSGGGLFNTAGELIGIVNAKLSGNSSSGATIEGMGYAIPVSSVMKCVNDLKEYGYVTGAARLGVTTSYLQIGSSTYARIVVKALTPGGSAEKAGIRVDDIIVAINGTNVTSMDTVEKILTAYSVGDTIEITIKRPTEEAKKQTYAQRYWDACQEIKISLTFVEFNPNA